MKAYVGTFQDDNVPDWFEGVSFQIRMTDNKRGAYCKGKDFCLIVSGCHLRGALRDIVAIGRTNGQRYSAANQVPMPFLVNSYLGVSGKSAAIARNIVNRLSEYIDEPEEVLFREYRLEEERFGVSYTVG